MPSANIKNWEIYLGGTLGALGLGLVDVLRNGTNSMVLKLGYGVAPVLKELELNYDGGGGLGLVLLVVLGLVLCWVHQPQGRAEAYARGASVFAILATLVPPPDISGKTTMSMVPSLFSTAHADEIYQAGEFSAISAGQTNELVLSKDDIELSVAPDEKMPQPEDSDASFGHTTELLPPNKEAELPAVHEGKEPQYGDSLGKFNGQIIELILPDKTTEHAQVVVRDYDSARILSVTQQPGSRFDIQQPEGRYILDIEVAGLRRSRAVIDIGSSPQSPVQFQIPKSSVPLNLQRLYSPAQVLPEAEITQ